MQNNGADGDESAVTVTGYQVITLAAENQEGLPAGTRIALIKVKQCLNSDPDGIGVSMTWNPWTLLTSQSDTLQPLSAYGDQDFPSPLYDNDPNAAVHTGSCRAGLIPFSLQHVSDNVVTVEYNLDDVVLDWSVG